ncbi:hypothetical protein [Streptomyces sp. NPDC002644]
MSAFNEFSEKFMGMLAQHEYETRSRRAADIAAGRVGSRVTRTETSAVGDQFLYMGGPYGQVLRKGVEIGAFIDVADDGSADQMPAGIYVRGIGDGGSHEFVGTLDAASAYLSGYFRAAQTMTQQSAALWAAVGSTVRGVARATVRELE